jgi:hypothetical protein
MTINEIKKVAANVINHAEINNVPLDAALDHVGVPLSGNTRAAIQFHVSKKLKRPIEILFKY